MGRFNGVHSSEPFFLGWTAVVADDSWGAIRHLVGKNGKAFVVAPIFYSRGGQEKNVFSAPPACAARGRKRFMLKGDGANIG